MNENGNKIKKTGYKGGGPRFGIEKPAIPGPGRPRLPEGEKERRKYLRNLMQQSMPRAIEVLHESLNAKAPRDRIRAAEVLASHSLPRQEEVEMSGKLESAPPIVQQLRKEADERGIEGSPAMVSGE